MLGSARRRSLIASLVVVGGLALVGGVTADTGALPAPQEHDSYYTWPGAVLLQVSADPWGSGYVQNVPLYYVDCPFACIRPFSPGQTVTLTAVPSTGFTFIGWEVANHGGPALSGVCPGLGDCTVTMDQAKDVVAQFSGPPPQPVGPPETPHKCLIGQGFRTCDT